MTNIQPPSPVKPWGIYVLTSPSGKKYVGQTIDFDRRMRDYARGGSRKQRKLYFAIAKYGWETFTKELVVDFAAERLHVSLLTIYEEHLVEYFKGYWHGYNCTRGGERSNRGSKWTDEAKREHSARRKGCKGHPHTQEFKDRQSLRNKARKGIPGKKGIVCSDIRKKKIGDALRATIPDFAIDDAGNMRPVIPMGWPRKRHLSEWHDWCFKLYHQTYSRQKKKTS